LKRVPFETLLFDVDGTLIDSNGAHAEAWVDALREHRVDAGFDDVRRLIGMGGDKLLMTIGGIDEASDKGRSITQLKKQIFRGLLPTLQPMPGARPLLSYLREQNVDLVIATSADEREVTALLAQAGIEDLIPRRATKDDVKESKPDPDIVHAAMARSNARVEHTGLIGDTPYDIEAARAAGIRSIALRCGGYWTDRSLHSAADIFDDPQALLAHWRDGAG
jgi:HAD superfamily hydrolase (TIGR01509 family)